MPFTNDPANNEIDRVRLITGDIDPEFEFLDDNTYSFVLNKNSSNVKASAKEAARYILATITRYTRERAGDIEVYGNEFFKNYRSFLLDLVQNPNFGNEVARPYAGGISKEDMADNDAEIDNLRPAFYRGFSRSEHVYNDNDGELNEPFEI